jgi:tellurium resistance protein TerD
MPISLSKGQGISLSKEAPTLTKVLVGLGWDERVTDGDKFDLDLCAFLLNAEGKVYSQPGIVGYMAGCETGANSSVVYSGDNRTGEGEGDDEFITVDLNSVPAEVQKIVFTATIHDAVKLGQNFGGIESSLIRFVNSDTNSEEITVDLREDCDTETAMIFAELYRHGSEWKVRNISQGFASGLEGLCGKFGVDVA